MYNDRHSGNRRGNPRAPRSDPLLSVEWCRVIDHPAANEAIVVVTEPSLHVIRLSAKQGSGIQMVGSRIYMGSDISQRDVVQDILGFARIRDLSNASNQEMPLRNRRQKSSTKIDRFTPKKGGLIQLQVVPDN